MSTRGNLMLLAGMAIASGCAGDSSCDEQPGTVCAIAGTGERSFNGDGHVATETSFYLPSVARRGPDGLLYVMDFNNMRLRRIETDGTMSTVAGNGEHSGAIVGDPATESSLENPIDFDFLPDGSVVIVSSHDARVLHVDIDGRIQILAGNGEPPLPGREGDGGPATDARFWELSGIAVAPDGAIYIADTGARRVRVIRDGIIDTVAGTGSAGYAGDGGSGKLAMLSAPSAVALDAAGNVYISDTGNCAVRKLALDGTITTVAGMGQMGFYGDGQQASSALLAHQDGIAVSADGTLYIADRFNHRIRSVSPSGEINTIAGTGETGATGDGGQALDATFGLVARLQIDSDGGMLVADQSNGVVRKIHGPF